MFPRLIHCISLELIIQPCTYYALQIYIIERINSLHHFILQNLTLHYIFPYVVLYISSLQQYWLICEHTPHKAVKRHYIQKRALGWVYAPPRTCCVIFRWSHLPLWILPHLQNENHHHYHPPYLPYRVFITQTHRKHHVCNSKAPQMPRIWLSSQFCRHPWDLHSIDPTTVLCPQFPPYSTCSCDTSL